MCVCARVCGCVFVTLLLYCVTIAQMTHHMFHCRTRANEQLHVLLISRPKRIILYWVCARAYVCACVPCRRQANCWGKLINTRQGEKLMSQLPHVALIVPGLPYIVTGARTIANSRFRDNCRRTDCFQWYVATLSTMNSRHAWLHQAR